MNSTKNPALDWHDGEIEMQRRAGVRDEMNYPGEKYKQDIAPGMVGFLSQQQFAVISTLDQHGLVWAYLAAGLPGLIEVTGPTSLLIRKDRASTSLPVEDVRHNESVGLIVIDFSRRIRVRINGRASIAADGSIALVIDQLYGNCTQYIQKRILEDLRPTKVAAPLRSSLLNAEQREFVNRADTFFIASRHPQLGADASHRGGLPGFVQAVAPDRITFPDYAGNHMFNTLGNIALNPHIGLLFVDFASGRTLQVSGIASVDWNGDRIQTYKKAERVIDVAISAVQDTQSEPWLGYRFIGYSPTLG